MDLTAEKSVWEEGILKRTEEELCLWIYNKNKDTIYRYLKTKFPYIPQEDMRDIMQNTWTDLVREIRKLIPLDATDQLKWLLAVGKIEGYNWYRKNQKLQFQSLEEVQEMEQESIWEHLLPDPVQDLVLEKLEALEIIKSLTEPEWKLLYAACEEPLQKDRKLSTNAERCKRYRARKKLMKRFGKGAFDE